MKKVLNVVLLCLVIALVYANFSSVNAPLDFDKKRLERDLVVIDRLVDIRTAQVEYRAQNGRYAATFDELIAFLGDSMKVVNKTYLLNDKQLVTVRDFKVEDTKPKDADAMEFSEDEADQIVLNIINDANPKRQKKNAERLQKLNALSVDSTSNIAETFRRDTVLLAYVDTLYHNPNYDIQQLRYIPFSKDSLDKPIEFWLKADSILPNAQANRKAGGYIQVFEVRADFVHYLQGLNEQELNNYLLQVVTNGTEYREEIRVDKNGEPLMGANGVLKKRIPCRRLGDVTKNNNNAGNW